MHGPVIAVSSTPCQVKLREDAYELTWLTDAAVWSDPDVFRPERWLEQPDAPLFTYGVGYRMCAGSLLANRELYLLYMRLLNSFHIEKQVAVDCHPVRGNADPTSLVAMPHRYKALFVPRNDAALSKAMKETELMAREE